MKILKSSIFRNLGKMRVLQITLLAFFFVFSMNTQHFAAADTNAVQRRVNAPYLGVSPPAENFTPTVFWFGAVNQTSNSIDVRVYYFGEYLSIVLHIIDRRIWFDQSASLSDFTNWDAVSLYLDLDGNSADSPGVNAYLLRDQLHLQASYRGNGIGWVNSPLVFTSDTNWRGGYPNNDQNDEGWSVKYDIPFTSLGLSGPPSEGTIWGLAIMVHDRDDASGSPIPDKIWPETMQHLVPSTWGQLHFGVPGYDPPVTSTTNEFIIRHEVDGAMVEDAHVGGHTTCGDGGLNKWTEWGEHNYAGYEQFNIQNQWDLADWPCFSKFFINFPLDTLPQGKEIISGTLSLRLFGNAGGGDWGEPPDSYINVLTVAEDWEENTLTWNNAPMAVENISGTWVYPRDYSLPAPYYYWDVSRALFEAYTTGTPLRLALYSADGPRHTGKYFWTSDYGNLDSKARPTLHITLGDDSCLPSTPGCFSVYLPLTIR